MASRLKANIIYNFAYQVLILILPLITAPYLSRVIGADGIGTYSFTYSIATYFTYFTMLGLNNYGNRCIARCQNNRKERSQTFWSLYCLQAICFLCSFAAYLSYTLLLSDDKTIFLLQGLFVLSSLFDINWFFFGMELFKLTVIRNTVIKIATVLAIFLFVKTPNDVGLYVGIMASSVLLSQLALWPFLRRYIGLFRPTAKSIFSHLKPNLVFFVSVIAISLYNTLSRIILGELAGMDAVGYFDNAAKVISVPIALITAVGTVMLPHASALPQNKSSSLLLDKTLIFILAFSSFCLFGIPSIAYPFTTSFFGPEFQQSAQILIILCGTIPLMGFGNVIRTQYIIPRGRDSVFVASAFCGAVVNIAINLALIPSIGAEGSAIASVAAEFAVLFFQLACVRKELPLKRFVLYCAIFALIGTLMYLALLLVPGTMDNVLQIAIKIGAGLSIYAPISYLAIRFFLRKTGERNKQRLQ